METSGSPAASAPVVEAPTAAALIERVPMVPVVRISDSATRKSADEARGGVDGGATSRDVQSSTRRSDYYAVYDVERGVADDASNPLAFRKGPVPEATSGTTTASAPAPTESGEAGAAAESDPERPREARPSEAVASTPPSKARRKRASDSDARRKERRRARFVAEAEEQRARTRAAKAPEVPAGSTMPMRVSDQALPSWYPPTPDDDNDYALDWAQEPEPEEPRTPAAASDDEHAHTPGGCKASSRVSTPRQEELAGLVRNELFELGNLTVAELWG